jgi:Tfp pilus assembly protein PilN
LESLEREYRPNKTMLAQLVSMRQKLEELQQQEAVASELEYQRNALTLLGVISETAKATKGRVRVTKVELVGFQDTQEQEQAAVGDMPASGLVVSGVSLDNPAVTELVDGLKEAKIFSSVELLSSKEREEGEASMQDYAVRCVF